ncbi:hypothetical protein ACFY1L_51520 [Streptomyces sp. NPDC001663]|uniref:hypothetical protein n=1 Tax=Streptomyces sp. NPDC001663 TaxID=3364597 RepID=UPI00368D77C9
MHKLRKAAVLVAALGSVGFLTVGAAHADGRQGGGGVDVLQSTTCRSHDLNLDVLGSVGLINGLLGNGLNGEGNSGAQETSLGSDMGCNNGAFNK